MISFKPLFNRNRQVIAYISARTNGDLYLYDKMFFLLGRYERRSDGTFDRKGQFIGPGNLVATLIK